MYVKCDDRFCDFELDFLSGLFELLDEHLAKLQARIDVSLDPEITSICSFAFRGR